MRFGIQTACALVALVIAAERSPAQAITYAGGLQYATGDFVFTQRTWSVYFSNSLILSEGPLQVSASIPLVMQPSGWIQYSGAGMMVPTGGINGPSTGSRPGMGMEMHGGTASPGDMPFSRVGIGDPIGRVDFAVVQKADQRASLRVVGTIKAPLADVARGFGTGEWDVGAGLSGNLKIGSAAVLTEAVYWKLGNPPGASLRNGVAYALWIGWPFSGGRWSVLGNVSGASSLWKGLGAPVQAGVGAGHRFESGQSMFATVAAGVTRTAPAFSTGLGWRIPFGEARQRPKGRN